MSRRFLPAVLFGLMLGACGEAGKTPAAEAPAAPPPGPPTYQNIVASPAAYTGKTVEFPVVLAAGDIRFISGESGTVGGQTWNEPADKENSVGPAPGYVVGKPCIFVVAKDDNTPVLPLQPIAVDNMTPCFAESSFRSIKLSGTIAEVRDVQLEVDKATVTLKAPALTAINFVTPQL